MYESHEPGRCVGRTKIPPVLASAYIGWVKMQAQNDSLRVAALCVGKQGGFLERRTASS